MNRRLLALIALVISVLLVHAAFSGDNEWGRWRRVKGSGDVTQVTRELDSFHAVEYGTIGTLVIEIGSEEQVVIEAEDNLIDYFDTDVRGGTLVIDKNDDEVMLDAREPVRFRLTVKSLDRLEIHSSGDIIAPDFTADRFVIETSSSGDLTMGRLECDEADIVVSSSGNVTLEELTAEILEVEISSSGDVSIEAGRVAEQDVSISSSGDYQAGDVDSERVRVRTSSSGDAFVRASERLDARTSSSGDIVYRGDPRVRKQETSSGDVRRAKW